MRAVIKIDLYIIHPPFITRIKCGSSAGKGRGGGTSCFFFSTSRNVGSFRTGVCVSDATAPSPPWIVVSCESPPRTGNLARLINCVNNGIALATDEGYLLSVSTD